jgi:hypothetical protein
MNVMREHFHVTIYPVAYLVTEDGRVGRGSLVARVTNIEALAEAWRPTFA